MAPEAGDTARHAESSTGNPDDHGHAIHGAKFLLAGKRDVFERGARLPLQKEKIDGSELIELMEGKATS